MPPLHYDNRDGKYWFLLEGKWTPLKKGDLKLHFKKAGIKDMPFDDITTLDWPIWKAQTRYQVDFAGPMAGHRIGVYKFSNKTALVTEEAADIWKLDLDKKLPKPERFLEFAEQLLPDDQCHRFLFWCGIGLEALVNKNFTPGQLVVMAGESGCGKSLMQSIITEIFGSRVANPFKFLVQGKFNGALAGAEHWAIEDPDSTTDMKTRRLIGTKIKQCLVNSMFEIELKGKDAISLPLFRRLTLTVNNEPENLSVVPPMDQSMMDKVFLFQCEHANVGNDRLEIWKWVEREMPQIRSHLLRFYNSSRVPDEWRDKKNPRMKIASWHHPALFEILSGLSMEAKLLQMLDQVFKDDATAIDAIKGKAKDIEAHIRESKQFSEVQIDRMFPHTTTCGTLLQRLSRDFPDRVKVTKQANQNSGKTLWRIEPPAKENNEQEDTK